MRQNAFSQLRKFIRGICPLEASIEDALVDIFCPKVLPKGGDFIREGEIGTQIGFSITGLLRSYYISPQGEEHNKHFFIEGSIVAPLTSLVTKCPSPVYIGAMTDVEMLTADYSKLEALYEKYPELNRLGRNLAEYAWIGKERRETQLIMLNASARYEAFLQEFPALEQRVPQYHIASYLGITPVQLCRIRGRMTKSNDVNIV